MDQLETPDVVQTGKPVTVRGPFDGDVATTKVDVGGHPSTVLAESPRKLVAQAPHDVIGLSTIHISEQAIETAAPVRSVSVGLSAPKLMLRSGESTTVTAKVTGLEDLRSPLVLDFSNETPDVIRLEGGDAQHTVIMPGRVEPDGSYTLSRQVTATRAGSFEISVMLPVPQEGLQEPPDASRPTIAQSKDKNKAKGKWVLVEWIMTRPEIQEEAVLQLADILVERVNPEGLAVVMEADHFCMHWRGVKDDESMMTNSVMRGAFLKDANLRREFLSLLSKKI